MKTVRYRVTCKQCKKSSLLNILDEKTVMYIDHVPIIAARLRGDLKWGFECLCGNDSRLAPQEKDQATMLMSGISKERVEAIAERLEKKPYQRFSMVQA